jgi:acyl-CoA synthetase (AMP-forming)/AMP-acid ligase II
VTSTVMVPTMIGMMLGHPEFAPSGSQPPDAHLRRAADARAAPRAPLTLFPDIDIYQGYGMTESSAVLTALGPDDHRAGGAPRSQGRPLSGVVPRFRRRRQGAPPGETGEVCASRQLHALVLAQARRRPRFRGGWYHSGDAATSTMRATSSSSTG